MRPDADLLIDTHLEIDKRPHHTGTALLGEYLTAVKEATGTELSTSRVQDRARRLRNWLKIRELERSERVKKR